MIQFRNGFVIAGFALIVATSVASIGFGDGAPPVATTGDQVTIKRESSRIIDPGRYRVPLSLEALNTVTLVAPFDGKIKQIAAKVNAKVQSQGDVVRLDNSGPRLLLNRANAALRVATLEMRHAEKDDLAQAKVDLAKADVDIAQSVLDQASVLMPFDGEIQRILVSEGQFVRAGDPLAIVADGKMMKVEIPVNRSMAENGKPYPIKIEAEEVEGKIAAVLPLPSRFEPLRDLFDSIASIQVIVDNSTDKFKVGQTVYVQMIPRQPVIEVTSSAVGNQSDGQRKVQVVRQNIVRDISVELLGQVGAKRVFVSGAFADGDEVIYESSHVLGDAFQLKPSANSSNINLPGNSTPNPSKPATGTTGF